MAAKRSAKGRRAEPAEQTPVTLQEESDGPADDHGICECRPMLEPQILYRSMSLPELADIVSTGYLIGGGNLFNDFERRTDVFFGDHLSKRLIAQGEDFSRQVVFRLRHHSVRKRLKADEERVRVQAQTIVAKMEADCIPYDPELVEAFEAGLEKWRFRKNVFSSGLGDRAQYLLLFRELASLCRKQASSLADWHSLLDEHARETWDFLQRRPVSSAIIRTRPISGGTIYRLAAFVGETEYGFRPGQVRLADIASVLFVKDGAVVFELDQMGMSRVICATAPIRQRVAEIIGESA